MTAPFELYELEKSQSPLTVCVTGATGFLGGAIIERLLASGHKVRATMRDASRTASVQHLLDLPGARERLKLFSADLVKEGSFDDAVSGCDCVLHTASPFIVNVKPDKVQEMLLEPAVKGVENVIAAVNKAPSVTRVVQTSSVAAIYGTALDKGEGHVFTEEDWNETSTETMLPYSYSKTLAEKRAWELAKQQSRWQLVVVNPVLIYGPPPSARKDSESVRIMTKLLGGEMWPAAPPMQFGWVDIRDVAAAHCLAMLHPNAQGRYLCVEGSYTLLDMAQHIKAAYPGKYWLPSLAAPAWLVVLLAPLLGYDPAQIKPNLNLKAQYDNSKIQQELGLKFTPRDVTIRDMVLRLAGLGLIKKP